jgi:predicted helicase
MSVLDVLEEIKAASSSEADKGSRFERLIVAYLRSDPAFADQFEDVWLWQDWPGRAGKHDTGIDLVARQRGEDTFVAIQCKFYDRQSTVSKPDIDTFLSASGKAGFTERIIVSTTDKWNMHGNWIGTAECLSCRAAVSAVAGLEFSRAGLGVSGCMR